MFYYAQKVESQSPSKLGDSPVRPLLENGAVLGATTEEKTPTNVAAQPPASVPPVTSSSGQNSSQATTRESSDAALTNSKEARLIGELAFKDSFFRIVLSLDEV